MKKIPCILIALAGITFSTACEERHSEWDDIDYSRIARENQRRENDRNYIPPISAMGCSDDDLYNCNK